MVGLADSSTWSMVLLAQDGTQPPPHEAVDIGEHAGRGMLEVAEPSFEHRVKIFDDPLEALAPATSRFASYLVLERFQALLSDQSSPCLEPIAKEVKSLAGLPAVSEFGLVRMKRQAVGRCPFPDITKSLLGLSFGSAEDHEVIRVPHHFAGRCLRQEIKRVQVEVRKQR